MSYLTQHNSTDVSRRPINKRITATLQVQASWKDEKNGNTIFAGGVTENLGETSLLVNLEILPPVGSEVNLRMYNEENFIIEILTRVIRVERDPGRPLAALSVVENSKKWKQIALPAAENWLVKHIQSNYDDDWLN